MNYTTIVGIIIIVAGLSFMTYLILWSRRTIKRIADKRLGSIREIVKELHHDR